MDEILSGAWGSDGRKTDRGEEREDSAAKDRMERETDQRINWKEPEERYFDKGEFIGPNTYRSQKLDSKD